MTIKELRNSDEYKKCCNKIKNYSKGFKFTVDYWKMTKGQANAMKIILDDCEKENLIQSIAIDLNLNMEQTAETFIRV